MQQVITIANLAAFKMGDTGVSMSREKGFLDAFFQALAQYAHDKAKNLADKEKEAIKTQVGTVWNSMLSALAQLAVAEKSYSYLNFMASKGFFRKDNSLRQAYDLLRVELRRTEELGRDFEDDTLDCVCAQIAIQLGGFVYIRELLIDFYEKLCSMATNRVVRCNELNEQISNISQINKSNIHHPYLTLYKNNYSFECDTLTCLLNAQNELQQWSFMSSLMHLHAAHMKLSEWAAASQLKESRRLSFGPGFLKPTQLPHLYQWLMKFKGFLVSKFTLYFHEILSKQTNQQEMKSLCSKAPVDLYQKMSVFQRKGDAIFVGLVYGVNGEDNFTGHGYHHPARVVDHPKGISSYPAVVCCPGEKPIIHWPNLVTIIEDREYELNAMERVVCFYDKFQCTYMVVRIEHKMNFVAILNGKRSEKESYITTFLDDFCSHLRLHKVLLALRPGSK